MKRVLLLLLCLLPVLLHAQKTPRTVTFDGVSRSYIEFVPPIYDGTTAVPLVIALHGLGDTDDNFSNVGFEVLSLTENFIVVTPQALSSFLGNAWNSGAGAAGVTLNPNVKDIEFISFLIDSFSNHYNIDLNRVYATGFSMGGFMSNRLACELNDRIAAIGSVAGTIGTAVTCNPGRAVPMIHFHGTSDGTVGYTNNNFGSDAEETVEFWADNANCDETPDSSSVPDAVADGITLTHYVYSNGDAEVEFFKAIGAGHSWLYKPNNDIYYTEEIWNFLSRQSLGNSCADVTVDLGADVSLTEGQTAVLDATTNDATYLWSTGATTPTISVTTTGTYSVTITVGDCTASDDVDVDFVTGLLNHQKGFEFNVYPNPMVKTGIVEINAEQSSDLEISIYDLLGQRVYSNQHQLNSGENRITFELNDIASGSYLLSLKMDGKESSQTILVQ